MTDVHLDEDDDAPVDDEIDDEVDDDDEELAARRRGPVLAAVGVLVFVALLVVVLATRQPAADRIAESPLLGQAAPAVAGTTLDGDRFSIADEQGRFVLVNFFATWCVPCQQEHDDLVAFSETHADRGDASVVSVVFDDATEDARAFFAENGGDWPVVVGDDGEIALDYGVLAVPESFLVAPDGSVLARVVGGVTAEGLESLLRRVQGLEG
ncbi:MAG: TlpA family protein disulfide reductase [Acidimicrobiia bacterium]|nr:TlpA family protein disulfide reductase [Acidimicrobiia bacterium]